MLLHLRGDSEDNGVGDLAGGSRDEDALGLVVTGGGSRGEGALGNLVEASELVEGS